ncbi:MAG TPA: LLM class flavin-dependent oxidoreductase [Actinocrinis sp.]|nr:LLM class flavin-dependent oxidoreductase [Actinocrinis sp.]
MGVDPPGRAAGPSPPSTAEWGVLVGIRTDADPARSLELAILADLLGYREVMIGEATGHDAFALATAMGRGQARITVGPLPAAVRDPVTIARGAASVAALTGRRVDVALSASTSTVVEDWHGRSRGESATVLAESALVLRGSWAPGPGPSAAGPGRVVGPARANGSRGHFGAPGGSGPAGRPGSRIEDPAPGTGAEPAAGPGSGSGPDGTPGAENGSGTTADQASDQNPTPELGPGTGLLAGHPVEFAGSVVRTRGFTGSLPPSHGAVSILAFDAELTEVAVTRADRIIVPIGTVEHMARLRGRVQLAAERTGRPTPRLALWIPVALDPDETARRDLLRSLVPYLRAPGFAGMFSEAGFGELIRLARSGAHIRSVVAAAPDDLLGAIGGIGSVAVIRAALAEYRAVGVDDLLLVPDRPETLEALAGVPSPTIVA